MSNLIKSNKYETQFSKYLAGHADVIVQTGKLFIPFLIGNF